MTNIFEQPEPDRMIGWEKWRDPFGQDLEDQEWPGAVGDFDSDAALEKLKQQKVMIEKKPDKGWNEDGYDEPSHEVGPMAAYRAQKALPFMVTPFGIIPVTEHTRAGKVFNFWTAHTNFRATRNVIEIIENTHGVESFDLFTPYRWRIAIGKAFDSAQVKDWVMKNLEAQPLIQ